jgi:hypothetical protein
VGLRIERLLTTVLYLLFWGRGIYQGGSANPGFCLHEFALHVPLADARPWLAEHAVNRDLVHIDLFQGRPCVPFYLTTVEFFLLVR